ncbi:hypothetical protein D9615_002696 [Tricholomella constricta]|uniref:Uncharacterized protein n=1 Tax=Tricholomella constricta TaxID=117010 RepID=A0A8H5M9F5_9AGAR|nr:hypothetical protein D9615_002696 [Tricholomella constricta]
MERNVGYERTIMTEMLFTIDEVSSSTLNHWEITSPNLSQAFDLHSRSQNSLLASANLFAQAAFTPMIVSYIVQIFPFALRAKAFTILHFAFTPNTSTQSLRRRWKYYVITVLMFPRTTVSDQSIARLCLLVGFETTFVSIFIVETKKRTLEETAA